MRYRDARKLHAGDEVIRKIDQVILLIKEVELFGQHKKVKFSCVDPNNISVMIYNDEVK